MADFFRSVIEDTVIDLSVGHGSLEARIRLLQLETEKLKRDHVKEMSDMRANADLMLSEKIRLLQLENEKLKRDHVKELSDTRANADLMLGEMKKSMEFEKMRCVMRLRKQCEAERIRAVDDAKRKQWCAHCGKEAKFYCCWNTSYCNYPCQQQHWPKHLLNCSQSDINKGGTNNVSKGFF